MASSSGDTNGNSGTSNNGTGDINPDAVLKRLMRSGAFDALRRELVESLDSAEKIKKDVSELMESSELVKGENVNLNDKNLISKLRTEVHRKISLVTVTEEVDCLLTRKDNEEFAKKLREKIAEVLRDMTNTSTSESGASSTSSTDNNA